MANLILTDLTAPGGLWSIMINWINQSTLNFAWAVILFTLLIKLILSPFDFWIKFSTKKSTLIQQKCAPQIAKMQKKYGNNQQQMQLQQQAIYKKEGLNMGASCLVMLVNLIVTILVFFSIYTTLRESSAYYAIRQYQELDAAYSNAYNAVYAGYETEALAGVEGYNALTFNEETASVELKTAVLNAKAQAAANAHNDPSVNQAVTDKWDEVKDSWLWITNIWVNDGRADALPTYDALSKLASNAGGMFNSGVKDEYVNFVNSIDKDHYSQVTQSVIVNLSGWNGYYILAVAAGIVTFLSTLVSEKANKLNRKQEKRKTNQFIKSAEPEVAQSPVAQSGSTMKIMKLVMPIIMIIFVVTSSAAFGIYIVTQSIVGIGIGASINLIVNKLTYKKQLEVNEYLDKIERKSLK